MLALSHILLADNANPDTAIESFAQLKSAVQQTALANNELFFNVDIEPPAYPDRPTDWHEQLNLAFEAAR